VKPACKFSDRQPRTKPLAFKRRPSSSPSALGQPLRRVLFLCSGNYYRSRFAEALFNHHARAAGWPWRAFSRGLSTYLVDDDISPHTRKVLLHRGISLRHTAPAPRALTRADLAVAAHIVALKDSEHRRIIESRFPQYADQIEYWQIHDLDASLPAATMTAIEKQVRQLARRLLRAS